eukprot:12696106-Alexandrium_andersonii.AAC.1
MVELGAGGVEGALELARARIHFATAHQPSNQGALRGQLREPIRSQACPRQRNVNSTRWINGNGPEWALLGPLVQTGRRLQTGVAQTWICQSPAAYKLGLATRRCFHMAPHAVA